MQQKIRKAAKKLFSLAFATILLVNTPLLEVNAAENVEQLEAIIVERPESNQQQNPNARTLLVNCIINVYNSSDGMLVDFVTDSVGTSSTIGVKDIKIEKKVWYGWSTVAVASGAEWKNRDTFACSVLYTGAEYGKTYRVSCTHYGTVDEYTEVKNVLENFVFTY